MLIKALWKRMHLNRSDLSDFAYFMAIARHRSFRKAAQEAGVTPSALSHAMSALEERRGVRLLNRTTRSVTLTAAGEDLFAAIEGPLRKITEASASLDRLRDTPAGRIRINVLQDAVPLLLEPVMAEFVTLYPEVMIDLSVTNRMVDVIGSGFDAGIRYGGTVPEDMVAQSLSPDLTWIAAASPGYIAEHGAPQHPDQLRDHRCVGIRLGNGNLYKWEFEKAGETIEIETPGPLTVDESYSNRAFGRMGIGIIYGTQTSLAPDLASGALERVLADWHSPGEGFYAYYSSRRQLPTALRLLFDLVKKRAPMG